MRRAAQIVRHLQSIGMETIALNLSRRAASADYSIEGDGANLACQTDPRDFVVASRNITAMARGDDQLYTV